MLAAFIRVPESGVRVAKQTIIQMTDDIDGSAATQTVEFSYRGKSYSIDLNDANASDFDDALAPYISAAEEVGGSQATRSSGRRTSAPRQRSSSEIDPKAVRAWAEANGVSVSPRGRIKAEILEQYRAAAH
jgi:hypothetical protein